MKRSILVTGAGGFIGYHLSNDLADRGHNVIGVDLHYPEDSINGQQSKFRSVVGDFRNQKLIEELLDDIEIVFHLASAHLQISLSESEYWDINVHSLRSFLELVQKSSVQRFIHVSSVGAYGDLKNWPANEETSCEPQSIYGETKLAGEAEVHKFTEEKGIQVVIIRPAWVYGPMCPRTLKIYKALRKGRFIMVGKGENLRHPLYIVDMLDAFRLAMEREEATGELFVIGGESAITTNELVESFCKVMEIPRPKIKIPYGLGVVIASVAEAIFSLARKEPPISKRTLEFFDTNNAFDISKARKVLGFNPRFTFEEGLRESKDWLLKRA